MRTGILIAVGLLDVAVYATLAFLAYHYFFCPLT
jgi:uncharacterized membrane protein YhiD involved in acid resistance